MGLSAGQSIAAPPSLGKCLTTGYASNLVTWNHTQITRKKGTITGITDLSRNDLLINLNWLVCKEWGVTSGHLVDQHSQCPPVHRLIVPLKQGRSSASHHELLGKMKTSNFETIWKRMNVNAAVVSSCEGRDMRNEQNLSGQVHTNEMTNFQILEFDIGKDCYISF